MCVGGVGGGGGGGAGGLDIYTFIVNTDDSERLILRPPIIFGKLLVSRYLLFCVTS